MRWTRPVAFAAAATFMIWGPLAERFGAGASPLSRPWRMFAGVGLEMCAVDFRAVHPDGTSTSIDRYGPFGYHGFADAPDDLRFISGELAARHWARALCEHQGPAPDVRVLMKCADDDGGWQPVMAASENECSRNEEAIR